MRFVSALLESMGRRFWLARSRSEGWSTSAARPSAQALPAPLLNAHRMAAFYTSPAWRSTRYAALARSRGRCECCGRSSWSTTLHVDHIMPRSWAPELALEGENLQVLCDDCNLGKGNTDAIDWRRVDGAADPRPIISRDDLRARLALCRSQDERVQALRQILRIHHHRRELAITTKGGPTC